MVTTTGGDPEEELETGVGTLGVALTELDATEAPVEFTALIVTG